MQKVNVSPVPHHEIDSVIGHIGHELMSVYDRTSFGDFYPPNVLVQQLQERYLQLWLGWLETGEIVGFAVTRVDEAPGGRYCTVIGCGAVGDVEYDWPQMLETIEKWARDTENCETLFVNGRIGWKRVLEGSGYSLDSVTLSKALKDEDHNSGSVPVESLH